MMFFETWGALLRIVVIGTLAYAALILLLRVSGKRTLSKMNAFDLVITVAMGSTLATILLSPEVTLAEGVVALGLLVLLQFVITWTSVRLPAVRRVVKSEPTLLFHRGHFLEGSLRRERVTREEVRAAVRAQGLGDLAFVRLVVLETDGSISAVPGEQADPESV